MTPAARERSQVRVPMLLVSVVAWILLVIEPHRTMLHAHPIALPGPTLSSAWFDLLLAHNPLALLAVGWALMTAAMMAPLLIAPVRYIRDRSFARRRARSIILFVAGYVAIWMAAGALLLSLMLVVRSVADGSSVAAAIIAAIAVVWQCSPVKQRCLNRGHAHPELAATGSTADVAVLRFGLTHGLWCVGSCWALMLMPLLFSGAHLLAMAAVGPC